MGNARIPAAFHAVVWMALAALTVVGCQQERPIAYNIDAKYSVSDPQFERTMGSLPGTPIMPGNQIVALINGDASFSAMHDGIRSARKTVNFETYVYWKSRIGNQFAEAFADRARAGVKVHVLLDAVGASKIDPHTVKRMTDAGVDVRFYHSFRWFDPFSYAQLDHRTHRKLLIVDGKLAFTGGTGIADEWAGDGPRTGGWRDTNYRVTGPVVAEIQAAFSENWMLTTQVVLTGDDYFPSLVPTGEQLAQVCKSTDREGSENMELIMLLSIDAAAHDLRLESPYFVPDALTRKALIRAKKRGVRVQIIVPGKKIDEQVVRRASRATWGGLLSAGIEIYEYQPVMIHSKLLIVDDRWVSAGSANMDNRSFRINDEANLNVLDQKFAESQIRMFEDDKGHTKQITYENWADRPLGEKILNHLANLLGGEL